MDSSTKQIFKNFSIEIQNPGFYEINIFKEGEFGFKELRQLIGAQKNMGCLKLPVLIVCDEFTYTETEFLKFLAKNANDPYSKADAFVLKSIAQKLLANFYLRIFVPERPTKFFKDKVEAINWLKQYI